MDLGEIVKYVICGMTLLVSGMIVWKHIQIKYFYK